MKILQIVFNVINTVVWVVVAFIIILLFFINIPSLPIPELSFQSYITTSPSMEPTIKTGDVIFIRPQSEYKLGDVITFKDEKNRTITHRITSILTDTHGNQNFVTKGDNNDTKDPDTVPLSAIKGTVQFKILQVGYLLIALQNPVGFVLLFGLPVILIVIESLLFKKNTTKVATET